MRFYFQIGAMCLFLGIISALRPPILPTITIIFEPIGRICTESNEQCELSIQYAFSLEAEDTVGLEVSYRFIGAEGIPLPDPYGTLVGVYPNYAIVGVYPIGDFTFLVEASNDAGEETAAEFPLEVIDCYAPQMAWVDTLLMPLMPIDADGDGRFDFIGMDIRPAYFSSEPPFEGCFGSPHFSLTAPDSLPNEVDSLLFYCWDTFPKIVRVWTWDEAENPSALQPDSTIGGPNYTKRDVVVVKSLDGPACDSLPILQGVVHTQTGKPYSGLSLNGEGDINLKAYTNKEGAYLFTGLKPDETYRFTVDTVQDHSSNGVTILDVTLLARHILNISSLDSPYKIIASDVNNSGSTTTLDIVLMRLMITGQITEFPGGTPSWRFVPSDYTFPLDGNPFNPPYREHRIFNNIRGFNKLDFVAIKMGDLNNSATLP